MANVKIGQLVDVQDQPGKWSCWSQAPGVGCWFLVPADDRARAVGVKHVRARVRTDRDSQRTLAVPV